MEWKRRIEERLKDARDQLQIMQSIDRHRNESIEADLLREIAILEQHLQNPPFRRCVALKVEYVNGAPRFHRARDRSARPGSQEHGPHDSPPRRSIATNRADWLPFAQARAE
jgi:hypothetical protein